jgi:uncharacterized protein (DUF427 family)
MRRIEPKPGQESVWDYPRPPALEPTSKRIRVVFAGETIVDSMSAYRVLETSHPPAYYVPPADVQMGRLTPAPGAASVCEWKGRAAYWTIEVGDRVAPSAAWSYPSPTSRFAAITDYVCFYANRVDEAWVDDERVVPQEGDFYGGWITSDVVGPFKGAPGTWGW